MNILKFNGKILRYNNKALTVNNGEDVGVNRVRFLFEDDNFNPTTIIIEPAPNVSWEKIEGHPRGNVWDNIIPTTGYIVISYNYLTYDNVGCYAHVIGCGEFTDNVLNIYFNKATALKSVEKLNVIASDLVGSDSINLFQDCTNLETVRGIHIYPNVKKLKFMFDACSNLTYVEPFDTSGLTDISFMFRRCTSLKHIPLLDVRNVTKCDAFALITDNVETGILDMYRALSGNGKVTSFSSTFMECGVSLNGVYSSESARLERAQIPTSWGGDMPD